MLRRALIYFMLLASTGILSFAQEVVTGLYRNIYIRNEKNLTDGTKGIKAADTLELPFFDDFSAPYMFPSQDKWADNFVFVNNTFSTQQITSGFATLDALDGSGRLYETLSSFVSEADRLTSRPINLQYQPSDNIYMSFFYEAGGLSDIPEANDSLVLRFWAPEEGKWFSVWKAPSKVANGFKPVIIRIDNLKFLKKGFRFSFVNYVSLSSASTDPSMAGNCDIWNLDYILIAKNRSPDDIIPPDVAFTLPVRSVLKTFEEMPWNQFRQVFLAEMGRPYITVNYRNNDKIIRNITRDFRITDVYKNNVVHSYTTGAVNIEPSKSVTYNTELIYTYNSSNTDSALFQIKCILTTDAFDRKQNDTIIYYQRFGRHFAFDDGTAEAGYGINGLGSRNAMVAYRFKSFIPDTLRAVQICFNDSYLNANQRAFDLMIWANNKGVPGNVLYTKEDVLASPGDGINGFYTYVINDPFEINGEFFVGWRQRSETFLNAGFDLNTPHNGRQLYYLSGEWNVSQMAGSIMIRPVFGKRIKSTNITSVRQNENSLKLWPNPASEYISIQSDEVSDITGAEVIITDISGRTLIRCRYQERIGVGGLPAGIYFVTVNAGDRQPVTKRLIISR